MLETIFSYLGLFFLLVLIFKFNLYLLKIYWKKEHNTKYCVGFFHPYCNAGGGGERVLWEAVRAIQKEYQDAYCVVYTGGDEEPEDILQNVNDRFNITLPREIEFVYLKWRFLVEAKYYPICTLLLQSLGSFILALEALVKFTPDVYIDTMGYAWTYYVFRIIGSARTGAYVHYPTISTDMLQVVQNREVGVNNSRFISNNLFFSYCKLIYYDIFAWWYGWNGWMAEVIMVNSSWTRDHIVALWKQPWRTLVVYPPCDVSRFSSIPLEAHNNKSRFLSIAQFRPEKDHRLQIQAFHHFLSMLGEDASVPVLVLVGSCRDEEDCKRVDELEDLCNELGISQNVEFKVNLTFEEVILEMKNASVALHTMKNEHFGIGVVECMSAGLIMIAHNSGGPKMDIVVDFNGEKTGFLATDVNSFADTMKEVWEMDSRELFEIRKNARESVTRFSVNKFETAFLEATEYLFA